MAVQNSVERRELGVATATTGFFRALGGAVGAAVLGAVFAAQAGAHATDGIAHVLRADVIDGVQARLPGRRPARRAGAARRRCACPSCPCRPPTASRREDQMASAFSTAVALRGEQSGGAISVIENTLPARWDGPPLHHHEFDEAFYVLDGEITFQVARRALRRGAGRAGLRARRRRAHAGQLRRRAGALPAAVHAGRLRGLLRPPGGRGRRRGPARMGAGAHAAGHHRRRADRRTRRHRRGRRRSRPPATVQRRRARRAERWADRGDGEPRAPGATGPPLHHHASTRCSTS